MPKHLWEAVQQAPPGTKSVEKTMGFIVPVPLAGKEHKEVSQPAEQAKQIVHNSQDPIPMRYWPEAACYAPEYNQEAEAAPSADCKIDKNRRLKLGFIKLTKRKSIQCHEAGEGVDEFLSLEHVLRVINTFTADQKLVVRVILELDTHEFLRSDLTRALKNKRKAHEIKEVLEQLVRKGLLKKLSAQAIVGTKGGRPKTEQYQLLFDKNTIPPTALETEG